MNSSTVVAPPGIPGPQRRNRRALRLLTIPLGVLLAGAVIAVNIPTVGTALADRYHQYQITRPAYEAKYKGCGSSWTSRPGSGSMASTPPCCTTATC